MSNRWVISWLVIDYWRWSISNQSPKILWPMDYSSMTHWLLDCYTMHKRNFSSFLAPFVFRLWFFYLFLMHFSLYLKLLLTISRRKVLIINTNDSQLCNLQNWTILTGQPSSVVKQKRQLKDTREPKFHGKWFFHFKILENLLKLNLETFVYI